MTGVSNPVEPATVLAARGCAWAARAFHAWLQDRAEETGADRKNVILWSPQESADHGYGRHWSVAWEEGPYQWTSISMGCTLFGPSSGVYSAPGPFPEGLTGRGWRTEMQNHWMLNFYKD